jgi:hypothetical protein
LAEEEEELGERVTDYLLDLRSWDGDITDMG